MLIEFGESGLIDKARQQPDKVRQVLDKLKVDGLFPTVQAVKAKLDLPIVLGYSSSGEVIEVGEGVRGFNVGDHVISNGPHAEIVCIPQNLCAKVPPNIRFEHAAFTVLGSIALHGIRLAQPTLGETFAVMGLGLVGLLTVQLLKLNGCRVIGIDLEPSKQQLAAQLGINVVDISKGEDPLSFVQTFTKGRGVDGVLLAASTKSSEPLHQAAQMCRKRGRIILVGVTGLEISRSDFYEKELTFQVSCSYGPGRYDSTYELKGHDYPFGYVRWTEQRNFEAILDLINQDYLKIDDLITYRFEFSKALDAYKTLISDSSSVGIILSYDHGDGFIKSKKQTVQITEEKKESSQNDVSVGLIGCGNHAARILLPALAKLDIRLKSIASRSGVSSTYYAKKYHFEVTTTDVESVMNDPEINAIIVATRHDTHAKFVKEGLKAGKHIFVEKPLAISEEELKGIETTYTNENNLILMVGFNRRFAPQILKIKELLDTKPEPKSFIVTINAGMIPEDHWVYDPQIGGGRIIGEGCHFVDLIRFLAGYKIVEIQSVQMGIPSQMEHLEDRMTSILKFEDGSFGSIHYLANGSRKFPKERLEVFCGGKILQLDNYRRLKGFGWPNFSSMNLWTQDKGHHKCIQTFINAVVNGSPPPIPFGELKEVTQTCLEIVKSAT